MNDPHVVALFYEIDHHPSVNYSEAEPLNKETDRFHIRMEDKLVRVELKEHYASEDAALTAVKPYLRSWELDEALTKGPGRFKLRFDRSEIIDRRPTPGVVYAATRIRAGVPSLQVNAVVYARYPTPPSGVTLAADHPDVLTMFNRYEGYLSGSEPLPGMVYFCLTVLEGLCGGDRSKAVKGYRIGKRVLNRIGTLTDKGGPEGARKHRGIDKELTPEEIRFLKEAVRAIIHRVAEVAQDPDGCFPKITLDHLSRPHG